MSQKAVLELFKLRRQNNGYIDDISGWDFFGRDNDPWQDYQEDTFGDHGDGTHSRYDGGDGDGDGGGDGDGDSNGDGDRHSGGGHTRSIALTSTRLW